MATYKTQAIILGSYPYREHDRIVSFFSPDFGRIEGRARGVRKIESKLAGHLEPFITTELLLANGRKWDILAGSRTRNARALLRSDVHKTAAASVCVEAIKRSTRPFSRERGVYELLESVLDQLGMDTASGREQEISGQFTWELIKYIGFAPELSQCINCKQKLKSGSFSCEGGGMLCKNCATRDVFADAVAEQHLAELHGTANSFGPAPQAVAKRFWNHVFEYPLESWNFLKTIT